MTADREGADAAGVLPLFSAFGIEIEYAIVDRHTLDVRPLAELLLRDEGGGIVSELSRGTIALCNELVLHVLELKTDGPAPALEGLAASFQQQVRDLDALLATADATLMPTGMHPWMDPDVETRLWPHEYGPVYETFHRIFDCRGHGWSNLQSCQLNLPFAGDDEFARLHAAIRVLLPIMPALTASTPFVGGRATGVLDNRMRAYQTNARRVPSVAGLVVPENASSRDAYEDTILERIYRDMAPLDPAGVLRHEWINARGAIARFDRSAIEIRVLDAQECPAADLTILAGVSAVLRTLVGRDHSELERQRDVATEDLADILWAVVDHADQALIDHAGYLRALGVDPPRPRRAAELWRELLLRSGWNAPATPDVTGDALALAVSDGPLARRILRAVGSDPSRQELRDVYRELCACLVEGRLFVG